MDQTVQRHHPVASTRAPYSPGAMGHLGQAAASYSPPRVGVMQVFPHFTLQESPVHKQVLPRDTLGRRWSDWYWLSLRWFWIWDPPSCFPASSCLLLLHASVRHRRTPLPAVCITPSTPQSQSAAPGQIITNNNSVIPHHIDGAAAGVQCPGWLRMPPLPLISG